MTGLGLHIGAVDREAGNDLAQHLVQLVARVVAVPPVAFADLDEQSGEPVDIAAQQLVQRLMLLRPHQRGVIDGLAGELGIELGEWLLAGGIDEQAADAIQEVVASGAGHRPGIAKALARFEDFLDHDPGLRGRPMQPLAIGLRVAQAIRVVNAHPVEHALSEPSQDQRVRVGEDLFVLHAQGDQGVNVEEPPIAEIASCGAPERQAIVLALEQRVQGIGIGVELGRPRHRRPQLPPAALPADG